MSTYPTPVENIRDLILPQIAGLEDGCRILGYKKTADCLVDLARKLKALAADLEKNWIRRPEARP